MSRRTLLSLACRLRLLLPMAEFGRIRVGCSGWQDKHWRGNFYPDDLPQRRWFDHYATVFDTVEINNSFYRLPENPRSPPGPRARRADSSSP